jgi:spermidine synthase
MKNKRNIGMVEVSVFVCGAILMMVEISGGRLLAAEYGGTIYVWGSLIAVILSGLSLGYYFGGSFADKKPTRASLGLVIMGAGFLVACIPLFYKYAAGFISAFAGETAIAPLIAVAVFFFLPSMLLGMVSPFAIKLNAIELKEIGATSGNLYALATLGSVLGTFLATFWLVLWFPLSVIFFGLGGCLFILSFFLAKKYRVYIFLAFVLLVGLGFLLGTFSGIARDTANMGISSKKINGVPQEEVSFSKESHYGRVEVKDERGIRSLYIDGGIMGAMDISDKFKTLPVWGYVDFFEKIALSEENIKDVLNLGVGPGLVASRLSERHAMHVDAVDINETVLDAAQRYFGLTPGQNLTLFVDDARLFLKKTEKLYDLIELDAFKYNKGSYAVPPHLTTREFFQESKNHLKKDGIFAMLVIDNNQFFSSEYATLQAVFKNVYGVNCSSLHMLAESDNSIDVKSFLKDGVCREESVAVSDATIFTDDFAPVTPAGVGK